MTLALLGLFQTVAAMRRMNRKIGAYTDSRKGIFADAVSNCVLPFLSSLPTCASFNRMWLVYRLGGDGRVSSAISALILLLMVLFLAPLIAIIPMPAMAAVIMLLGANMINWEDIGPHFKDRREAVVFLASFHSVLFLDLRRGDRGLGARDRVFEAGARASEREPGRQCAQDQGQPSITARSL